MILATRTIQGNNSGLLLYRPKIVVMHATRSGIASKTDAEELLSTLNWFINPKGASSHWILSEAERVKAVEDDLLAWHSGFLNDRAWGVELTQPIPARAFTDGHYANAALIGRYYVSLGVAPVWLDYWNGSREVSGFVDHADTVQGRASGKTDVGPMFDRPRFIASLEDDMTEDETRKLILEVLNEYEYEARGPKGPDGKRPALTGKRSMKVWAGILHEHTEAQNGYTDARAVNAVREKLE